MYYLYGLKPRSSEKLVATFDSEQQLRAYVHWATLKVKETGIRKFEQGSVLAGYEFFRYSDAALTDEAESEVFHDPTPSML